MSSTAELPATSRSGYFPPLDGLRALAILMVIPHNVSAFGGALSLIVMPAVAFVHAGWVGVQLFFVLSGFLITGALLDSRDSPGYYASFYWRRVLRILPLYYGTLLLVLVIVPMFVTPPPELRETLHHQIWYWLFLCNWTQPYDISVHGFAHFWSLAVEEQFYLLWPLLVRRTPPATLLRICLAIALAALCARWAMQAMKFPVTALYMFTVCRMDALALGAAAAAAMRIPHLRAKMERRSSELTAAGLGVLALGGVLTHAYSAYDAVDQTIGYLILAIGFALMVIVATLPTRGLAGTLNGCLGWQPLRLIGRYSYAMYVFHFPLHIFFGQPLLHRLYPVVTPAVGFAYGAVMVLASFVLGAASYHLFEKHFLRLKTRVGAPRGAAEPA